VTSLQVPRDRPESNLGKGRYEAPLWIVAILGALAVAVLGTFLIVILVKRLRARREDLGPISSRGSVRPGPPSTRPPRA
jgi:hypothetical protein